MRAGRGWAILRRGRLQVRFLPASGALWAGAAGAATLRLPLSGWKREQPQTRGGRLKSEPLPRPAWANGVCRRIGGDFGTRVWEAGAPGASLGAPATPGAMICRVVDFGRIFGSP